MKKYFIHEFKKSMFLIGCLTVIAVAICLVQFISIRDEAAGLSSISTILFLGGLLAFCLPFWVFNYKMKKRSVDLFYALPLSHTKIITVKFLVGLTVLFIPFTVAYWLSFLILACIAQWLNAVYYIPMFFASIIPIYLIYAISAFTYTRANRQRDGRAFSILWFFGVALFMGVIAKVTATPIDHEEVPALGFIYSTYYIYPFYFTPAAPLTYVTSVFTSMAAAGAYSPVNNPVLLANLCAGLAFITLWGIGSTAGLILLEKKAKAENTEQISESRFGYKVLIPLYTTCFTMLIMGIPYISLIFIILIFISMFAVTATYRRTVKIGWKQFAVLGASIAVGIILHYLSTI